MQFPILDSWTSIKSDIIDKYLSRKHGGASPDLSDSSRKHLFIEINSRLRNPLYHDWNAQSIVNTIKYVYWETRAGVFVSIKNNKLEAFLPFANAKYRNDWANQLSFFGVPSDSKQPVKDYLAHKKKVLGNARRMMLNPTHWWANHHFLNVESHPDVWGQHSLLEYYEMISEALSQHTVGDCMFVINKRDHPILRADLRKPYSFLYRGEAPLIASPAASYGCVLTSYTHPDYLDIPMPIVQDWLIAAHPDQYYPIVNDVPWSDKQPCAFFRGAATGRLINNQRIHLAELDRDWREGNRSGLLDAGLTSWNLSDKIDSGGFVHYIIPHELEAQGIRLKSKVPMNDQVRYKYLLNVDGHTAPNRTSWQLKSGCLMLLVESQYQDRTWIDHNIKAWKHYVPIAADLSDLEEKILWCREHDAECIQIVKQAQAFAALYFSRDTISEYMAYLLSRIASNRSASNNATRNHSGQDRSVRIRMNTRS